MRVVITGATGFIGRALVQTLIGRGDHVIAWTRDKERARALLGPDVELVSGDELDEAVDGSHAVVNLAGEPIVGRWTKGKKQRLVKSRVDLTERVMTAIERAYHRPGVVVSASAIGIFQQGFAAELCEQWEAAAQPAKDLGCRLAIVRIGLVLGAEGGMLATLLPVFRAGLGGQLSDGKQSTSWIHLDDMVRILEYALDTGISGTFTATAPIPVSNAEFTKALGAVLGKPTIARVPGFALKLVLGEAAQMILQSPQALPGDLLSAGFEFKFRSIDKALRDILDGDTPEISAAVEVPAEVPSKPRAVLRSTVTLDAPIDTVFSFFSAAENLGLMTPPWMGFRILSGPGEAVKAGDLIDYRIKLGPLPMRWRTEITVWDEGTRFVDNQLKGPYSLWWHEHRFVAEGDRTIMADTVYFTVPFGPIGRIAERLFVRGMLRRVFRYRSTVIRRLFADRQAVRRVSSRASAAA